MASRMLSDLNPEAFEKAIAFTEVVEDAGLDVLIYCTWRSEREQAVLYRRGRPLSEIEKKAIELSERWARPDLGELLMSVGPQHEPRIVTNAGPGQSLHQYHVAFDCVPIREGKPVWGDSEAQDQMLWQQLGALGEQVGLEWAGRWHNFREMPHFQLPGIDWRALILGIDGGVP